MSERSYYFKDKKHYAVGGTVPPSLIDLNNKKSIVPWWVNVPLETTLEDVIWIKEDKQIQVESDYFEIKSSSSNEIYRVTKKPDNKYHCTCQGYWRSKDRICKHIKQVINENSRKNH